MSTMPRTPLPGFDQAAPTLRSAQVAAAHAVWFRPVAAVAVEEAPSAASMGAPASHPPAPAVLPTPLGAAAILSRVAREVVASLGAPEPRPGQASSRRSLFGLLGMACRSLSTDALLARAAAARVRSLS
jgi:hypothetical protein